MNKRVSFLLAGVALVGLACLPGLAQATQIAADSQIDITGGDVALPGGGAVSAATGLDFLNHGVAGTAGGTISLNSAPSGSFSALTLAGCPLSASAGGCGTIVDLPAGSLTVGALAIANFFTITEGGITAAFNLLTLTDVTRIPGGLSTLSISGTGIFDMTGFDPTPGVFTLTTQGSRATTFSASTVAMPTAVPEPASMAVLGLGMLGLGLVRRRSSR